MDLTPIRVRGSRRPKQKLPSRTNMKRAISPIITESSFVKRRKIKHLSPIEQLPTELLHAIFSINPSIYLPLSSPYLASALTSKSIFLRCLDDTFRDLLEERFTYVDGSRYDIAKSASYNARRMNRILQCKWLTWDVFEQYIHHFISEEKRTRPDSPYLLEYPLHIGFQPLITRVETLYIPSKLLHPPWTLEKTRFLEYLCNSGFTVNFDWSTDHEIATIGFDDALKEDNSMIVDIMLTKPIGVIPTQEQFVYSITHGCSIRTVTSIISYGARYFAIHGHAHLNFRDNAIWTCLEGDKSEKAINIKKLLIYTTDQSFCVATSYSMIHRKLMEDIGVEDLPPTYIRHRDFIDICNRMLWG